MPKKISETGLVAKHGMPKVSWGQSTGLLKHKPLLVFKNVAPAMHLTIIPDEGWCFNQMAHESGDTYDEETNKLHTSIDDLTFDEFHVTEDGVGSAFFKIDGTLTSKDSLAAVPIGKAIGQAHLGWK